MKTQYYTASSLDGFIATEDDSLSWLFQLGDVNQTSYPEFIKQVGALAMGASTYMWMVDHLINPPNGVKGSWPYSQPTWVFTHRSLPAIEGANIQFVQGDVRPVHQKMRAAVRDCLSALETVISARGWNGFRRASLRSAPPGCFALRP